MSENVTNLKSVEIVQMDLDAIYIGNLNTVEANLNLPETGKYGSSFVWNTGESRFVAEDGTVHRPLHGMGNRKVILTVTASYEGCTGEREFIATVLQEAKETIVTAVRAVEIAAKVGEGAELPSVVIVDTSDGRRMTMPVKWEAHEALSREGTVRVKGQIVENGQEVWAEIHYCGELQKEELPEVKGSFFPIEQVRLLEGTIYYEYQQRMIEYLLSIDDDQMLYNFRKACGLDILGAEPMTGWDEDSCKLKGHTSGHYMSGIALAWAATGDERFLQKINYMVDGLKECQDAFAASGEYHRGFLSAYSEEQFDLLEEYVRYPEIWAPYYTLDKIMSGLYDCWKLAGNKKAGEILDLMGDWVYDRLSRLPKEVLDKMWSMYIAGEYGGMFGTMVKVYEVTGKENHLKAARLFVNEKLFYPMEQNCDTLEDMHANQHIPQIMGAMDMYRATGEGEFWRIGKNFWNIVTGGHIYCIGGTGETEMFHRAGTECTRLTEKTSESCASYNMLRLTAQLFDYTMDGAMMDYFDNTLRNHTLTSCSHTSDGGTTYFMPLGPGQKKEYSTTENTCCHGTGMESRFRYMENIYAQDAEYVYVNLLIDSVLSGETALEVRGVDENGNVTVKCLKDMDKKLKIHVPGWAGEDFKISVNGEELAQAEMENGYVCIPGCAHEGDVIVLQLLMKLRMLDNASDESLVNLAYGPYILAMLSEETEFLTVPELADIHPDGKLHFEANGMKFIPFAEVDLEHYHVYFKRK